jgi:hypothetical protein
MEAHQTDVEPSARTAARWVASLGGIANARKAAPKAAAAAAAAKEAVKAAAGEESDE